MNTSGRGSENLVAQHPANLNAARHGLYSDRPLAPRIEAYREQLLSLPHVAPVDQAAIDEWRAQAAVVLGDDRRPAVRTQPCSRKVVTPPSRDR